jgi:DinB family
LFSTWRIALHVVNHASYHRGQITTMLRQLGREPIGTDLMAYYRSLAPSRLGQFHGGIYGTLARIFQGDSIWFDRLDGVSTSSLANYAPDTDFAAFSRSWLAVLDRWVCWAETLDGTGWDRIVPYRNTKGEPDSQPTSSAFSGQTDSSTRRVAQAL